MKPEKKMRKPRTVKGPHKKWTDSDTEIILDYLKGSVMKIKAIEKPTAKIFYQKLIKKTPNFMDLSPHLLKNKVRNLRQRYLQTFEWRNNIDGKNILEKDGQAALNDRTLKICPYWDSLDAIFSVVLNNTTTCYPETSQENSESEETTESETNYNNYNDSLEIDEDEKCINLFLQQGITSTTSTTNDVVDQQQQLMPPSSSSLLNDDDPLYTIKEPKDLIPDEIIYQKFNQKKFQLNEKRYLLEQEYRRERLSIEKDRLLLEKERLLLERERIQSDEKLKILELEKNERITKFEIEQKYKFQLELLNYVKN